MNNIKDQLRILIVDDEADVCYLLSGMLKKRNFNIDFTHTISGAETALGGSIPALVILDHKLPDGWGADFIPFIKNKYPGVKILMLTAHAPCGRFRTPVASHPVTPRDYGVKDVKRL